MKLPWTLALIPLVLLGGCATQQTKYYWGNYDPALYAYYKDPTRLAEYAASLDAVIKAGESKNMKVPPGIYAEYGYLQLQAGKGKEAAALFEIEATHWPESRVFMDRMIAVASNPSAPAAATPSPATEGAKP